MSWPEWLLAGGAVLVFFVVAYAVWFVLYLFGHIGPMGGN